MTEGLTAPDGRLRQALERSLPNARPDTIGHLVRIARIRHVEPGDPVYRESEPVPLTLILDGYGAAQRTTSSGKIIVSGVAPAGVLFGWSGVTGVPSSIDLVALTRCEVAQWAGSPVRALVAADSGFALSAIDSMAWSLHQTIERIEGFLHQDARLRVLRILARHRDLFFDDPPILTRADLPGLVGTSREMTGNVLRQLEREGILRRVGRVGLELVRPDELDRIEPAY